MQERFLKFVSCDSGSTGKALANHVVKCITDDQCYDGADNMAEKYSGLSARIPELNSLALNTHCMSHRLNLVVASSCNTQSVQNVMDKIMEITNFCGISAKRHLLLDEAVKRILPVTNITSLVLFARLAGLHEVMAGHISLKCTQQSWNLF